MAYAGISIVDYLKSIGKPSDYSSRAVLAQQKGITNYTGTAEQNTQLLKMLNVSAPSVEAGIKEATETFADIQKQAASLTMPVAAKDLSVANAPTPTPAPTAPPPDTSTGTTGNAELDELYEVLKDYVSQNTLNPDIQLTPVDLQRFYDQAASEINPYYASQISAIRDDLAKSVNVLQKQFEIEKQQAEAKFRSDIAVSRESAAGAGTIFSGARGARERDLASLYSTNLESQALTSESQIGNVLRGTEAKIGSRNIADLGIPSFTSAEASTLGRGAFMPGRTLSFAPTGGVTGSLEYQQRGDIRTLEDLLAQEEIKKRSRNTSSLFK